MMLRQRLEPYWDVLLFVVCLLGANMLWKLSISGDEHEMDVWLWHRLDLTPSFAWVTERTANTVAWCLQHLRPTTFFFSPPYDFYFESGFSVRIVWSCAPIKQAFIWLVIMLFARGSWRHKLWFIPVGWLVATVFNVLRIVAIDLLCEYHPSMFTFWHGYVFKYVFYGIFFLLWVLWIEKLKNK